MYCFQHWNLADPICTFVFSVLVLITTVNILRDTLLMLMEGAPRGLSPARIRAVIEHVPGVKQVHELHCWALTNSKPVLVAHVAYGIHSAPSHLRSHTVPVAATGDWILSVFREGLILIGSLTFTLLHFYTFLLLLNTYIISPSSNS